MKRDMDLVRELLFAFEQITRVPHMDHLLKNVPSLQENGYSYEQIEYHMQIMAEAGLLTEVFAQQRTIDSVRSVHGHYRLSWDGQDFLETIRSDTRWNTVKERMADAGGFALSVAKAVAIKLIADQALP